MDKPRTHLRVRDAAKRLAHGRRWILARIADGTLEGFKHGRRDMTVSLESILAYESTTRVMPQDAPPFVEATEPTPA